MAGGVRQRLSSRWLNRPGHAWVALAGLLALGAVAGVLAPVDGLDWQPARAAAEPWRMFTAAFVHLSALHLWANLAATTLVAAWGWVARAPLALALAWAVAWPLTHAALALRPTLVSYGGLSGVLHAGVAAVALWLWVTGFGRRRWIAGAVLAGLLVKLLLERPWGPVLQHAAGWDIAIAPLAHATGAAAGLLCAGGWLAWVAWMGQWSRRGRSQGR